MYDCLRSDRLDGHFKHYLRSVWWRAYRTRYKDEWEEANSVLDTGQRWREGTRGHGTPGRFGPSTLVPAIWSLGLAIVLAQGERMPDDPAAAPM